MEKTRISRCTPAWRRVGQTTVGDGGAEGCDPVHTPGRAKAAAPRHAQHRRGTLPREQGRQDHGIGQGQRQLRDRSHPQATPRLSPGNRQGKPGQHQRVCRPAPIQRSSAAAQAAAAAASSAIGTAGRPGAKRGKPSSISPVAMPAAATSLGESPPVRTTARIAFIGCTGKGDSAEHDRQQGAQVGGGAAHLAGQRTRPPHRPSRRVVADPAKARMRTLSEMQAVGFLAGREMSLALAAELNGYPGPMHVLEHAASLGLTPEQRAPKNCAGPSRAKRGPSVRASWHRRRSWTRCSRAERPTPEGSPR